MQQSTSPRQAGMGAVPHGEGVAFRVWAPHADAVSVRGTFNDWSEDGLALEREDDGYWYGDVPAAAPGDEYRFRVRAADHVVDRIDPYAREVANSTGNSVVVDLDFDWGGDGYTMPPWNSAVIYEMHIGTFNPPENGAGGGGAGGDLSAITDRFDHLRRLGVNVLQLMPAAEFAGDVSWGYNPAHIFAIESSYGGPRAFKEFVKAAHRAGFAVILDVVYNHFGPSDLDLWQFDTWSENDGGGIYFYNDWRAETPWGATRPDYGRPEVRQFIRDNALMWLRDYHVDGLRWDATLYIRSVRGDGDPEGALAEGWQLMRDVNAEIREEFPGALTVAEDLQGDPAVTSPAGAGFGSQWDASFVHPIRAAVIALDDAERSMDAVAAALQHRYNDDAFCRVIYSESHDEIANGKARVPEEISPGDPAAWAAQKRSTVAAALVLTAPGIPMLFQGQEFLEGGWFQDTVPLDWDRAEEFRGIIRLYRDLIRLRRNLEGRTAGLTGQGTNVHHINHEWDVVAFHRWADGGASDDVVVFANFANRPLADYRIGLPSAGIWKLRLNSDWRGYSPVFGDSEAHDIAADEEPADGYPASGAIACGPYSVLILSQDREAAAEGGPR